MKESLPKTVIAHLAQEYICIMAGDGPSRMVDSVYGNSIREKAVRVQPKHSWKAAEADVSPFF